MAEATRRTFATVNSSAITARQPEVPKWITSPPASLTLRRSGPYNSCNERAVRRRGPLHRLRREGSPEHRAGARAARGGGLRERGADDPLGLSLESAALEGGGAGAEAQGGA